jgi:hypothetical protein
VNTLRRARTDEAAKIAAFQRAAYERNRAILGVEPIPLKADYAKILSEYEVWLDENGNELTGVLVLDRASTTSSSGASRPRRRRVAAA